MAVASKKSPSPLSPNEKLLADIPLTEEQRRLIKEASGGLEFGHIRVSVQPADNSSGMAGSLTGISMVCW